MMTEATHRRLLRDDENADARVGAFFIMSAILTVVLFITYAIAPAPDVGPKEGQLAPNMSGGILDAGVWEEGWTLYDNIDRDWEEGQDGKLILIQFSDTDCPYCWNEGEMMSNMYEQYKFDVQFYTVAVSLNIPNHDADRGEVAAFKHKTNYDGCKSAQENCQDRPGAVHEWPYIDDLDTSSLGAWGVPGTPFSLLLYPDGVVAWNPLEHKGEEEIHQALPRLIQEMDA